MPRVHDFTARQSLFVKTVGQIRPLRPPSKQLSTGRKVDSQGRQGLR